jgi:hypothetical protein
MHPSRRFKGSVVGFTELQTQTIAPKILLTPWVVKGKIAFENSHGFQGQIDDLPLECGIEKENSKNNIAGSYT